MHKSLLLAAPLLMTSACAILPIGGGKVDDAAMLLTQVQPEPLAACIGQAFGTPPVAVQGGYSIQTPGAQPMLLTVTRDDVQTVVKAPEGIIVPTDVSRAVIACGIKLAPPATS